MAQIFKLLPLFKESRNNIFCLHMKWNLKSFASSRTAKEAAEPLAEGFHRDNEAKSIMMRTEKTGLYGFDVLKTAKGFRTFVQEAIERSGELIDYIKEQPPSAEIIHVMDDISDTVCTVVDSAELCRNTHPEREYVEEANEASMKIYEYLHYLNTNHVLYDAVIKAEKDGF